MTANVPLITSSSGRPHDGTGSAACRVTDDPQSDAGRLRVPRRCRLAGPYVVSLAGGRMAAGNDDFRTASGDRWVGEGNPSRQEEAPVTRRGDPTSNRGLHPLLE
jgi:hypothetical protein